MPSFVSNAFLKSGTLKDTSSPKSDGKVIKMMAKSNIKVKLSIAHSEDQGVCS